MLPTFCRFLKLRSRRWGGLGRQIFGNRVFLGEFLPELLSLRFRNIPPTSIDLRLSKFPADLRFYRGDRSQNLRRRQDVKLVSFERGTETGVCARLGSVVNSVIRELLPASLLDELGNSLVLRSVIINYVIVIVNIRYVPRAIEKSQTLLRRHEISPVRRPRKIADPDKRKGSRADTIVTVDPWVKSDVTIESGFWREGCPAYIVVVVRVPPRYPGWGPLSAWHPDPASPIDQNPAAIVIGCPSEIFV